MFSLAIIYFLLAKIAKLNTDGLAESSLVVGKMILLINNKKCLLVWTNIRFPNYCFCDSSVLGKKSKSYFSVSFHPVGVKFDLNNPRLPRGEYRGVKVRKIPLK